ncbi:MAG TPA: hypothetical protein VGS02_02395 [Acidobacteriaceae bacterium]|nr:hypothetical protein [Acidobacteriaceae bacterium]
MLFATTGDFNGDGKCDTLWRNRTTGKKRRVSPGIIVALTGGTCFTSVLPVSLAGRCADFQRWICSM